MCAHDRAVPAERCLDPLVLLLSLEVGVAKMVVRVAGLGAELGLVCEGTHEEDEPPSRWGDNNPEACACTCENVFGKTTRLLCV